MKKAIEDLKAGKLLVVTDDNNREDEGDIVASAVLITEEQMNFMITHAKGLVCVPMKYELAEKMGLRLMVEDSTDKHNTAFLISMDYKEGTTTGISVGDRTKTARRLADKEAKAEDFYMPGHMFPLRAVQGGLNKRKGHTEAAVELMEMAGLPPVAVICEIINEDGTMARGEDLEKFSKKHGLTKVSVADIIEWKKYG
ncbi:MAG: 3,4-dihydroxy-2-butanone-4-phosphate synthase [Alphaproteobacteria bacterium]|nr:3,4-dihydroxy-2-butanone-4-phosphate synthase [Alphaproteobacteria bacterium]MCL2505465.1 3,4-dihydroxy-2-butanone-4-phosphate synthase [Alphaproteobacteria bacterium]